MRPKRLSLQQRKEIFRALTQIQDERSVSIAESRQNVMQQFKITDMQLRLIEDEGTDKDWPPLNDLVEALG